MRNLITIIILFIFCSITEAQQDTTFYNFSWKETKAKDSVSFFRVVNFDEVTNLYRVIDYYKEGKTQMKAFASDKKGENYEGTVEWFEKEGYLKKYINFKNGIKQGDSKEFNPDGSVWGEGFYKDDSLEGDWKWYYPNRQLSVIETYKEGKLIALKGWNEDGKDQKLEIKSYKADVAMEFPGGFKAMSKFILKNLKYPKEARKNKIEGKVLVTFSVEKDGELNAIRIARGIDEFLDKEALNVVKMMPKWEPACFHNQKIRVDRVVIPFVFKLD